MRERVAARSSLPMRHLVQMLYESAGSGMSVRRAAAALSISVDTGLRRVCVGTTGRDRSKQLECAAFLLLRRRFGHGSYWRGRGEVDFVIDHNGAPTPVQVSWNETNDRARAAVDEFQSAHPHAGEAVFITAESYDAGVPELTVPNSA